MAALELSERALKLIQTPFLAGVQSESNRDWTDYPLAYDSWIVNPMVARGEPTAYVPESERCGVATLMNIT